MDSLILNQNFKLKFYVVLVWHLGKLAGLLLASCRLLAPSQFCLSRKSKYRDDKEVNFVYLGIKYLQRKNKIMVIKIPHINNTYQ